MILALVLGLWNILLLFVRRGRSKFGSGASEMNMRISIVLIVAFIPCVLAVLVEIPLSLMGDITSTVYGLWPLALTCLRLTYLAFLCMSIRIKYRLVLNTGM